MNKKIKIALYIIAFLVAIAIIMASFVIVKGYVIGINKDTTTKTLDERTIAAKLHNISELASNKYDYTNVLVLKSKQEKFGITVPLTTSIQIVRFQGSIKAGIDFQNIEIEKVPMKDGKTKFILLIPKARILSNTIDTNKTTIEDVQEGILSKNITQEIINTLNKSKSKIEKKIIEDGFLETSNERILKLIQSFMKELDVDEIEYKIK